MAALETEEVITIADEPSSKKPRLQEDETDQISVSSESVSSVEISDDSDVEEIIEEVDGNQEDSMDTMTVVIETRNEVVTVLEENDTKGEETVLKENVTEAMEADVTEKPADPKVPKDTVETKVEVHSTLTEKDESRDAEVKEKDKSSDGDSIPQIHQDTIHEAPTQAPLNISIETVEADEGPFSLEVTYDYPSADTAKINILSTVEDEALPSTSDTDDIIPCGQQVRDSQETYTETKSDDTDVSVVSLNVVPKVNGNVSESEIAKNGLDEPDNVKDADTEAAKTVSKDEGVSIEDMMADFVDEVNEDIAVA